MPLRHDIRRGALCMLGATASFAAMGGLVKALSADFHFMEIMFFRSFFAMPLVVAIALRRGGWAMLRTQRLGGHVMRSSTGTLGQGTGFCAIGLLPLAEQTALTYTTPLFVTILSIPFLGEKVGRHRWAAVCLGFCGILVIALGRGAFGGGYTELALLGTGMAVASGIFGAFNTLQVRQLSATEHPATITLWQSLLMSAAAALALPFVWHTPSLEHWPLLVGAGILGALGQMLLTESYASAQVSSLGPYSYSGLLWAMALGAILWGEIPSMAMLGGACLIVLAGLYILRREMQAMRRSKAEASMVPPNMDTPRPGKVAA